MSNIDNLTQHENNQMELWKTLEMQNDKTINVMLDIETLDTQPTAVVGTIAAVAFTEETACFGYQYFNLDIAEQLAKNRTVGAGSLKWWIGQKRDVFKEAFFSDDGTRSVVEALHDFDAWLQHISNIHAVKPSDIAVWGNGANFDPVILQDLCCDFGIDFPFRYTKVRCYRTLTYLAGTQADHLNRTGDHHHALHDALHQAHVASRSLKMILNKQDNHEKLPA